jgi:uncharacterized NAD-dependent epimerase/dehydratase family protein
MTDLVSLNAPYLLFLGDANNLLSAKTATGIAHWRPDRCLAQFRLEGAAADIGLPDMGIEEAVQAGAKTLVIGLAPLGGRLPDAWIDLVIAALEAGLDVASGLHSRLGADPRIAEAARRSGQRVLDVREPPAELPCGSGERRSGRRLLTVGTDCCVGKMFAALAIAEEMRRRGWAVDFRATGQTGILIEGSGIAVDAVVSDFISGAVEQLAPANDPAHWDVIEGQGSLFHPAYAGVSLGLLHGAQPDALVLCHEAGRSHIDDCAEAGFTVPSLKRAAEMNLEMARLTAPEVRLAGVAMNTSALNEEAARDLLAETAEELGIPAVDPVRTGVAAIVSALEKL